MTATKVRPVLERLAGSVLPDIVGADGVYLMGRDGRAYLDAISGSMTANLGYTNPDLVRVLADQAAKLPFVHEARGRVEQVDQLAEELLELAPVGLTRAYFTVSGADAIEAAIRIACLYQQGCGRPDRWRVVATTHSYHGSTLGSLSATGIPRARTGYEALLLPFPHAPSAFCFRCPLGLSYPSSRAACADKLATLLSSAEGADVASFVFEPVIANAAGSVVPPAEYIGKVQSACAERDVVLVADEITTGLGRTGENFACDHFGLEPDILCVGKGLGVGYAPISAVLVHERIAERLPAERNLLGHNFNAHPIAGAVAREVLRRMREEDLVARVRSLGARLMERLQALEDIAIVADVRGIGLLASVEFAQPGSPGEPFAPSDRVALRVTDAALDAGVLVLPGVGTVDGRRGDHITLTPPFVSTEAEIDLMVARLETAIGRVAEELGAP